MRFLTGLFLVLLFVSATVQEPSPTSPPLPYENHGACPFECCTFRTWSVEEADFLTAEQKRDIFYNNAVRFLRLDKGEQ